MIGVTETDKSNRFKRGPWRHAHTAIYKTKVEKEDRRMKSKRQVETRNGRSEGG